MKILVLGAGKMTDAILSGLKTSTKMDSFFIYSPSGVSAKALAKKLGAKYLTDLDQVRPDFVMIGCKPQQLKDLKNTLNGRFKDAVHISMLAALSEEQQLNLLEIKKMIRIMPNMPVRFQQGVILLSSTSAQAELEQFQQLFMKLGKAIIVNEKELEELTLLTGSGPALFYEFAASLADCFKSLDIEQRELLVRQVLIGSGETLLREETKLSQHIDGVTSKGGVTIAVLEAWRKERFKTFLENGIKAGKMRALEIKELLQN